MSLNLSKCLVVFGNTPNSSIEQISSSLRMQVGALPVRYLGIPLVSRRLSAMDCKCLTIKLVDKIQAWTSKCLSYTGRLQLIQATLSGIQSFWISNSVLPKATFLECEKIMRAFLWSGSTDKRRAKVSWAKVCSPKDEGGLGLRRAVDCNRAAMMRLVWDILTDRPSLWVRWCKAEILKGYSIWRLERKQSLSVTWKILLNLRAQVSAKLVYSVGRSSSWSLWYDPWFQNCPLISRLCGRVIYDLGLPRDATLSAVILDSAWNWPAHVRQLREISIACLDFPIGHHDSISGQVKGWPFSFKSAWESIRATHTSVP
ncbi:hypothetical protein CFOL_v3_09988 [Cephalotus follicularis]|uniref:Zf-RVT domain-containing protein n=1 Tax=Cephalotus follicularis TaxID=3775 RepID=A0A1Q3BEV3_CEPFO|nr:hypothetical protein CFOL_v3_09988 [Cephalotus follicularis]